MSKFSASAKKATTLSPLMVGREKLSTDDVINKLNGNITVTEFDIMPWTDDDGSPTTIPVLLIKENPNVFVFGGAVLSAIVDAWANDYHGDIEAASNDLKTSGGCKLHLYYGKTKKGRTITNVDVIED